jgi:hypothetical protein
MAGNKQQQNADLWNKYYWESWKKVIGSTVGLEQALATWTLTAQENKKK